MDRDEELLFSLWQDPRYREGAILLMQDRKRKREIIDQAKDAMIMELRAKDEAKERLLVAKERLIQAKDTLLQAERQRTTYCKIL